MRASVAARFRDLFGSAPVRYFEFHQRGAFFAMKRQPPKNQPYLVVMKTAGDVKGERVLVDPNVLDPKGTTAIDFYMPSLDGRYVAVAMSEKGSEAGPAYVFDVHTGKKLADVVPRVQYPTGGGSVEWDAKGAGFYYTRYPQGSERPAEDANFYQQVYFHKLGTPAASDQYAIGKEFPRIAETRLEATRDGKYLLATVANGDGGEFSFYLRDPAGKWTRVAEDADQVKAIDLGFDGRLYARSIKDAPRGKVLAMPMSAPDLAKATVVVPEGDATDRGRDGGEVAPLRDLHGGRTFGAARVRPQGQGAGAGAHGADLHRGRRRAPGRRRHPRLQPELPHARRLVPLCGGHRRSSRRPRSPARPR